MDEHRGPISLFVTGSIPAWAAGTLYRTGPGTNSVETNSRGIHNVSHWFDGFAHTHKFDIVPPFTRNGTTTVQYSSRRQSDKLVETIKQKGWRDSTSFGQRADPCIGLFAKAMSFFVPRTHHNNNVVVLPNFPGLEDKDTTSASRHRTGVDNVYISTDANALHKVDPNTLEPIGYTNQSALNPLLKGPLSCAHAQRDPGTGDLFNFNLQLGRSPTYRIFRVNAATGKTDILATIAEPGVNPAYIHSFFLTANYVVLCIPTTHYGWNGSKILWQRNIAEAIKPFNKNTPCRWIVVDRKHGRGTVARFSTPASFFFHSINAFEETITDENGDDRTDLSLEYIRYDTDGIIYSLYYDVLLDRDDAAKKFFFQNQRYKSSHVHLVRYRFRLPLEGTEQSEAEARTAAAEEVIAIPAPHAGDLPTINPKMATKPHRYVYGVTSRGLSTFLDSLVKTDLHTREALIWSGGQGHTPGEPIYVPRPGATDEDDGVLLSVVLDGSAQKSYLLCLDARTLEEVGRAAADFPIAFGFHGHHAPIKATC
jgi:torulene dioxygenase